MAEHPAPEHVRVTGVADRSRPTGVVPPPIRKGLVLVTACMSTFLVNLDNTIVNVALPDIRASLHPSVPGMQWILDSYMLTLASLLVLSGSLGDRFGRRRVFQCGLLAFAAGSLLSSLAPSAEWLVAFRVIQALGASMLNPVGMSIISNVFVDAQERARAFGTWGGAVGLGMALGPVLGGLLVQEWGWRSVFWISIPIALAVAVCTRAFVPESRSPHYRRPDLVGQVLVLLLVASVIFVIIEAPHLGPASPLVLTGMAVAVCAAGGLWGVERRRTDPLLDFRFFRSVPFSSSMLIAVLNYSAIAGFLFLNTLYLQDIRGYSPLKAGLYTLPMALATSLGAQLSARILRVSGARTALLVAGAAITTAAVMIMVGVGSGGSVLLLAAYVVLGIGFGAANTPVNNIAMAGMPRSQAGIAGALASSSRQLGQSLGVAVFGAGLTIGLTTTYTGFAHTSRPGWFIIAATGLAIITLGVVASRGSAQRSAQRVAEELDES